MVTAGCILLALLFGGQIIFKRSARLLCAFRDELSRDVRSVLQLTRKIQCKYSQNCTVMINSFEPKLQGVQKVLASDGRLNAIQWYFLSAGSHKAASCSHREVSAKSISLEIEPGAEAGSHEALSAQP